MDFSGKRELRWEIRHNSLLKSRIEARLRTQTARASGSFSQVFAPWNGKAQTLVS